MGLKVIQSKEKGLSHSGQLPRRHNMNRENRAEEWSSGPARVEVNGNAGLDIRDRKR